MKRKIVFLTFSLLIFTGKLFSQGCSQCKLLTEQGSEMDEASFGSNINSGILYLMVIPYLIILFIFRKQILGFLKRMLSKKA